MKTNLKSQQTKKSILERLNDLKGKKVSLFKKDNCKEREEIFYLNVVNMVLKKTLEFWIFFDSIIITKIVFLSNKQISETIQWKFSIKI